MIELSTNSSFIYEGMFFLYMKEFVLPGVVMVINESRDF